MLPLRYLFLVMRIRGLTNKDKAKTILETFDTILTIRNQNSWQSLWQSSILATFYQEEDNHQSDQSAPGWNALASSTGRSARRRLPATSWIQPPPIFLSKQHFSFVFSFVFVSWYLYLYHDICVCVCIWHNHYVYLYLFWLCYWIISQKSCWPTFNITKWCEARDDFDYEWDDFDDWFCFRYLILILIFTWFWFCFRYFTYSMLLVLISCAVYQMMISALKVPWQWFQRWWFFFMNMTIICNHFSGRLPHAPIHGLPLHRPLQVCLFSPILSKSDILFTNTIIIMIF